MDYKIFRTYSAGVFAGYVIEKISAKNWIIKDARRLWFWSGAASLSQLAMEGVKEPKKCKFSMPVSKTELTEVIEILDVTEEAKKCIESVPEWKV